MVRNVLGVLAGMVVGGIANMAIVVVMMVIWPLPEGVALDDPEQMAAYTATLPVAAWLMAVLAHLAQCFVGGGVAGRLGTHAMGAAVAVGALSLIGGVMNLINLGAPGWMWAELPLYLVAAAAAGHLVGKDSAS